MATRLRIFGALALLLAACGSAAEPSLTAINPNIESDSEFVVAAPSADVDEADASAEADDELPPQELDAVTETISEASEPAMTDESGGADEPDQPGESGPAKPAQTDSRPLVIFDTDIGPDVDDVLALAMLHGYQKEGRIELGAVTISRNSPKGAQYSDAVNTFYGRPDIPIGIYRGGTDKPYDERRSFLDRASSWENNVADQPIADGYRTIRKILADNAGSNRQILIVQTGFAGNTSALLNSGGDDLSPRSGIELINANNTLLVYAAGSMKARRVEFNIENDIRSAQNLFSKWPGRMVVSPFEIGEQLYYPYTSIRNDFNWVDRHPVREAYEHRDLSWHQDAPPYYNMRTWDLTAVMQAVEPSAGYFFVSSADVAISINSDGSMNYQRGQGKHQLLDRYGEYSTSQRQRAVNRMIELTRSRP